MELKKVIRAVCLELFDTKIDPELTRPDEKFGDFSTNVAMKLAGQLGKDPREIANQLMAELNKKGIDASVAGAGFINIKLNDKTLAASLTSVLDIEKPWAGKTIVAEYSDPNPFKVLHAGHLYTSIIGDVIANLYEAAGAKVHRVNFGGDVGLHVAKTMWAILKKLDGPNPKKLDEVPKNGRSVWLAEAYIEGNNAYGDNEKTKKEIIGLNKNIYEIVENKDKDSALAKIYWTTRQWSYDYFEEFYSKIGSKFEKYYPESETLEAGLKAVNANIGKVFEKSDGAVVFKGEVHNMHTRVFINSQGLPTYETKDIGLILNKWQDYHFDKSVIITGNEIYEYMQVVLKAIEQIEPELAKKTVHLTHGLVKMAGGQKMSSRKGNILRAEEVLDAAAAANKKISGKNQPEVALGAVKYAFLKQGIGADIIYDPEESVAIAGNSGPYLQYAHARARSILQKAKSKMQNLENTDEFEAGERSLARKISQYPEVVAKATGELMPHHICTYLYELAQNFNRFYEDNKVIGDSRESIRLGLVGKYADVLNHGLGLLNIDAPIKM